MGHLHTGIELELLFFSDQCKLEADNMDNDDDDNWKGAPFQLSSSSLSILSASTWSSLSLLRYVPLPPSFSMMLPSSIFSWSTSFLVSLAFFFAIFLPLPLPLPSPSL
jgi:hypothetical protein